MNDSTEGLNLVALKRVSCTRHVHVLGEPALLNRRSFLRSTFISGLGFSSLAAGSPAAPSSLPSEPAESEGALTNHERTIVSVGSLDLLGRPRSWSLVRRGLHPISPERVVVLTDRGGDGWASQNRVAEARLEERLAYLALPAEKFHLIFRLMHVLADYYRAPHLFEPWAIRLSKREALGSTGLGLGFGLLHEYQDDGDVVLMHPPVDWWLCIFPEGVGWGAFDGEPTHGMIGHVFPTHHASLPALKLRAYELTSRVGLAVTRAGQGFDPTAWRRIATMDRINAARTVNMAIGRCLAESA